MAFTPLPPIAKPGKAKLKLPLLIGAAVVVIAALAVGGIVVFGGDDRGGNIATKRASGVVEDATNSARLARDVPAVLLRNCPFDGLEDLAAKAPKEFDAAAAAEGDVQAAVTQTSERDDPELIQCVIGSDDPTYGVAAGALPPTDIQAFISRTLTEATAKFQDTERFRGGTLLPFCTKPDDGSDRTPICSTAWYDSQLLVAIFTTGRGSSTDVTTAWLKTELPTLVTDLEQAETKVKIDDSTGGTSDTGGTAPSDTTG
ncbi:MAG: hypothetical protein JWM12_3986 [Ilumatobacteraceae bacterium]|nr:hypothetical protein [Ilumatobacteraceae bacterium]